MLRQCLFVAISGLLAVSACGKGDKGGGGGGGATIDTEMKEVPFGSVVVKGELPTWKDNVMGEQALTETVDGIDGVVVAAISYNSFGGTGVDAAKMKAHIENKKAETLGMEIAGAKPEVVEDVGEVKPGVLAYVTKANDFIGEGHEYTVNVFHMPAEGGNTMYSCHGRSRLARADLWKSLKSICADVQFVTQ
jgi:hypothetical protein